MTIKVGDTIPAAKLMQATPEGPKEVSTEELFAGKTVVLFGVPGAFTPTCSAKHLPSFVEGYDQLKAKGVDLVACMAVNDAFVMNAWGKVNGVKNDDVLFLSDTKTFFSKEYGWPAGMGDRNGRWAMVFDHGKVIYAENEKSPGEVSVSI